MVEIKPVKTQSQYDAVSELTAEYVAWDADETAKLGLDPQVFIDFYYGHEPETLPGAFAPPAGCLLLATVDGLPAGCGGYLRFSEDICVLKRMYVRPEYRGKKIGRLMITELVQQARMSGYRIIRLETASYMEEAHRLYQSLGFKFRPPYYEIPESLLESTYFMELQFNESGE